MRAILLSLAAAAALAACSPSERQEAGAETKEAAAELKDAVGDIVSDPDVREAASNAKEAARSRDRN